jgi:hypothetical protein
MGDEPLWFLRQYARDSGSTLFTGPNPRELGRSGIPVCLRPEFVFKSCPKKQLPKIVKCYDDASDLGVAPRLVASFTEGAKGFFALERLQNFVILGNAGRVAQTHSKSRLPVRIVHVLREDVTPMAATQVLRALYALLIAGWAPVDGHCGNWLWNKDSDRVCAIDLDDCVDIREEVNAPAKLDALVRMRRVVLPMCLDLLDIVYTEAAGVLSAYIESLFEKTPVSDDLFTLVDQLRLYCQDKANNSEDGPKTDWAQCDICNRWRIVPQTAYTCTDTNRMCSEPEDIEV